MARCCEIRGTGKGMQITDEVPVGASASWIRNVDASTASMKRLRREASALEEAGHRSSPAAMTRSSVVHRPGEATRPKRWRGTVGAFRTAHRQARRCCSTILRFPCRLRRRTLSLRRATIQVARRVDVLPARGRALLRSAPSSASAAGNHVLESLPPSPVPNGPRHAVTSRSNRMISSSACFRSASISSSGRGGVYL